MAPASPTPKCRRYRARMATTRSAAGILFIQWNMVRASGGTKARTYLQVWVWVTGCGLLGVGLDLDVDVDVDLGDWIILD